MYWLKRLKAVLLKIINVFMVALCNRADHYIFMLWFVMVALCNRETIYIFMLWFVLLLLLLLLLLLFSSPNLSGRRLDVYHTLAHGVALVRIYSSSSFFLLPSSFFFFFLA